MIVGGGVFAHATLLPVSLAWSCLANGERAWTAAPRLVRAARVIRPYIRLRDDLFRRYPQATEEWDWYEPPLVSYRWIAVRSLGGLESARRPEPERRLPLLTRTRVPDRGAA